MSSSHEHPSLTMHVTPEQRDRAESLLKDAYADGRLDEPEFDTRIDQVLTAQTRRDLNEAFFGLVEVPSPSPHAPGATSAHLPPARPGPRQEPGRGPAGFAHFSVFLLWLFGPGFVYALSPAGSYARREAAKAFNFQLISSFVLVPMYIVAGIPGFDLIDWLLSLVGLSWFVLTLVGGGKALKGETWRNPVTSAVKLKVLSEE